MSKLGNKLLLLVVWFLFSFPCLTFSGTPQNDVIPEPNIENGKSESVTLRTNYTDEQIESILARLSDDQVRRLLIAELQKSAANLEVARQSHKGSGMFSGF